MAEVASLHESFYRPLGDGLYASSPSTAGPWSPKAQHGGPPSALMGRAFEQHVAREGFRIARVTLELPRPVPVGDLRAEVRTLRSGGRTELLEGELTSDGESVLMARAWRVVEAVLPTLPGCGPFPTRRSFLTRSPRTRWRMLTWTATCQRWSGGSSQEKGLTRPARERPGRGSASCWWPHEEDTPLTRALTLADSSWGVAFELDHRQQFVINTDVTLALHREPVGEWLCVRSATAASPGGSGLALGQLDDGDGDCGRVLQTLLVADR